MNRNVFWELLEAAKKASGQDESMQAELLTEALTEYEPAQIAEFECLLCEYLLEADHFGILAAEKIIDGYVTDDSYLYFRCWLIAQGEDVFHAALRHPDSLADVVEARFPECEALLGVADEAFERRTGQTEDEEAYPSNIAAARGLDYEYGSQTKGEDWTENQLPKLLPKLWKKFGGA
ncbi:DUF4240 domain-containing protein [Hymenobacter sp. NST-14]|uniref:DUF4240 domain-containing protein n=1 Tax=Hymenobacter piscis TaxID=2839984 RepID=UPI001C025799|nr:DUF4240 domain-containing protein [Hymenobacter piscis]MBT9393227.1 DUF4240 domain-containing protein [Hymenobacter piscis]